jgi:hypothetical protein
MHDRACQRFQRIRSRRPTRLRHHIRPTLAEGVTTAAGGIHREIGT